MQSVCPFCSFVLTDPEHFFFCPNCGKQLKDKPLNTIKQIGIYAVSLLLPPLGLFPGFKYLFKTDIRIKIVGIVALILTIVSTVVTVYLLMTLMSNLFGQFNGQSDLYNSFMNGQVNNVYDTEEYRKLLQ
jgi:hypothetical protein